MKHFPLVLAFFITVGAMLGALGAANPFPAFGVVILVWLLYLLPYFRRAKQERKQSDELLKRNLRVINDYYKRESN